MPTHITTNPATGERLRWHVRSSESEGRFVRAELWCSPGGGVSQMHVHPNSEERFEVLAGRVVVEAGGRRLVAGPGDHVVVPAGMPHRWHVEPGEEAHMFLEVDDPRGFEELIETVFALGRRGALGRAGRPSLLLAACFSDLETARLAFAPLALQRMLIRTLRPLARLTGHRRTADAALAEARDRLSSRVLAEVAA